jgi:hypothetical protein
MDPVGIPNLWKDEASVVPVLLRSTAGVVQTSVLRTGITAKFACGNDTALQSFAPTADQWTELGEGHYLMTFPTTVPDFAGPFVYQIATTATGNETFIANSRVELRPEDRIWDEATSGHAVAGTAGKALSDAGSIKYTALASIRYNQTDADACVIAWLLANGVMVATPTSARVIAYDESGNVVIDSTNITPDVYGFFLITIDPLTLTALKAHRVRVIIVSAGVTYESGEAFITFN